jgi:hypothetical protein
MTAPSEASRNASAALLVLLLSALVFAWAHCHGLADPFVLNDDARQQIYWMQRWRDAALYPPNLLNDFAAAYVPTGVKALYFAAAPVIEPLFFTKVLAGILFCVLSLAFFGIGRTLGDRPLGFFCAASAWLSPFFMDNIAGGLSGPSPPRFWPCSSWPGYAKAAGAWPCACSLRPPPPRTWPCWPPGPACWPSPSPG